MLVLLLVLVAVPGSQFDSGTRPGFAPGERLAYEVKYGPFRLGAMELRVAGIESLGGSECYRLGARLELTPSLSWLFRARYDFESWCRASDMVTLRSYKRTEESNYRAEWTAEFEPDSGRVTYSDGWSSRVAPQSRDLLTLWYYLRTVELAPGGVRVVNGHIDRKNYRVRTAVTGRKRARVPAGTFDCLVVAPSAQGPLGTVLIAEDSSRTPVVIKTRVGGLVVSAFLLSTDTEE